MGGLYACSRPDTGVYLKMTVYHILRIPSVHRVPLDQPIKPSVRCHVSFKPPFWGAKIKFLLAGAAANPSCLTLLKVSVLPAT